MVHTEPTIELKGTSDGLLVKLDGRTPYSTWFQALETELERKQAFFRGSRIILAAGELVLDKRSLAQLKALFADHELELWAVLGTEDKTREAAQALGLATRLAASAVDLNGNPLPVEPQRAPQDVAAAAPAEKKQAETLLLRETIRSGRLVYHEGHVVIIGDVNPGAEVLAAGDVIVWGRIRGLVHAGALGNEDAMICGLQLRPTQLRIAGHIAIPPDERPRDNLPEQASVRDGRIVVEDWQAR